ncbi:Ig-like domain-containing protein [Salegentibacter sp. F14]
MGKKLHSLFFIISLFLLNTWSGFGQCTDGPNTNTSVSISLKGSSTICSDETISYESDITWDGAASAVYQWQEKIGTGDWVDIGEGTGKDLLDYTPQNNSKFRLQLIFCDGASNEEIVTSNTSGTITVVDVTTATASISSDKTLVCPNEVVTFSPNVSNEGTSPGYSWLVNGIEKETSATFSWNQFSDGDKVQLLLTSNRPCAIDGDSDSNNTIESNIITISVKPAAPDAPGTISGETQVCPNTTGITYSITPVDRATSYQWTLPTGWTGNSTDDSIIITSGNVADNQIIKVKAINECGESAESSLTVNVGPGKPDTPGEISDPGIICPGQTISLEVPLDNSVNDYTWSLPNGWSIISGQGTNQINVTAGNYGQDGSVSVFSTNTCLDSDARSRSFSINEPVPATPGEISGPDIVCPSSEMIYSISAVTYADQYIWFLDGAEITGQNGTSVTLDSGTTPGNRTLKVIAVNECVNSADYTTLNGSTKTLTVDDGTPEATSITQGNGEQSFCPGASGILFQVPTDTKIDSYSWQVPSGWSITGGDNTNEITVTAGQLGDDGQITFTGSSNDCGSVTATYEVMVKNPAPVITSQVISGETTVCHSDSGIVYSIPEVQYASNYIWSVPGNWVINSGNGTNSITVSAGTDNGDIKVIAENDCGQSAPVSLAATSIDQVPAQPTAISSSLWDSQTSSNDPICPPASGITFSVSEATDADSYNWILPTGWEISSGANTSSITVKVTAAASYNSNESVQVEAVNICGSSTVQTYDNIVLSDYVQVDAGSDKTVCRTTEAITISGLVDFNGSKMKITPTTNGTGTFTNVPNGNVSDYSIDYLPSQADIDNLDQVIITITTEAPVGACGPGEDEMIISFRDDPSVTITGDATICAGTASNLTISGDPNTLVTYTINGGSNQNVTIGSSGEVSLDSGILTENTTYDLVSAVYTDSPSCSGNISGTATLTVTQVPTAEISYNNTCSSETLLDVSLTGTNNYSGGTFSSNSGLSIDAGSGRINPSLSTPGIYTVTYTIPASEGCEEITVSTEVNISEEIAITAEPTQARACEGGDVQFEVAATGDELSYQWYKNSVAVGNEIGSNSNILNLTSITAGDAGEYMVVVSGTAACTSVTSLMAELIVDENLVIENQPEAISVCENSSASISISATSGGTALSSDYSYQWFKGSPGSGTPIVGATSPSLEITTTSEADSGEYYAEISGPAEYQCSPIISEAATLTVRKTPTVEISGSAEICSGNSTDLIFSNGIPNGIVTYTINNNNSALQTFVLDANGEGTLNTGSLVATSGNNTDFLYTIQSVAYSDTPECNTPVSGSATVTVAPDPDVSMTFAENQTEFCTADSATYTPILEGTGTYSGGKFSAPGLTLDENTGAFVPASQDPGDYTLTYTIPPYGGCPEETLTLSISIFEEVKITSQPFNVGICSTEDAEFSVSATGDDLKFQWFKDGTPIAGAENPILKLPVATSEDAGEYFVRISGTNACTPTEEMMVDSDVVTLNVDEDIVILEPAENVSVCETGDKTVEFRFVAHANGAPLQFTWIYGNGTNVPIDGNKIESSLTTQANYKDTGIEVYIGTLTIHNIVEADENLYAVQIDGAGNDFTCPTATSNAFELEVNPLPDAPVVKNIEYCLNQDAAALTATGTNLLWYDSPDDETPSENAPVPTTTASGEFTFYVSQTPLYCESELATITVTVNERPAVPGLTATEKNLEYCLGETASALTASAEDGAFLNWYDSASSSTPLDSAPVPPTQAQGILEYWVSQTNSSGCEGEREIVTVTINDLPAIVPPDDITICSGNSIEVSAADSNESLSPTTYTWDWAGNPGDPLSGTTVSLQPTEETIYTITGTNANGCINTSQFTISVEERPIGGLIQGPESVCISNPSGTLELSGHSGDVIRWEYKTESETEWMETAHQETSYDFTIAQATNFRAVIGRGVCEEVYSEQWSVSIDPLPVGGELAFDGLGRTIEICSNPGPDYNIALNLSGHSGEILRWRFKEGSDTQWSTIMDGENIFSGTTLSPELIRSLGINQSTIFEVEVGSGACTPGVFSQNATLGIVSSDIAPDPVTVTPGVVCFGEEVTLSGSTGYGGGPGFEEGGAFDFSSITNKGWRIKDSEGNESNFDSSADNGVAAIWLRTNPLPLITANLNSPGTTYSQNWDSSIGNEGNKGFAIVSGPNPSTLETSIFNLFAVENPVLTFDQAYNLTPGSAIYVEISTDGGATYSPENILSQLTATDAQDGSSGNYDSFGDDDAGPENKITLDLTAYASLQNLRIRFRYEGTRTGDVWAVDAISLPVEPTNVDLTWRDYTDPENPVIIGTNNSEQWTPKLIGWNDFEIRTRLTFDSTGEQCPVAENFSTISVFVFDQYTSIATANAGSCGNKDIQLKGEVLNGLSEEVTEFPTRDNFTASWEILSAPTDYSFSTTHFTNEDSTTPAINDPNAVFSPGISGSFTLRWVLERNADDDLVNESCPPIYTDVDVLIEDCTALDFDGIDDYVDLGTTYTGNYFIEAWIRPEASTGTIISGPGFEIKMEDLPGSITPNGRWYHIAVSNNQELWVDGLKQSTSNISGTGGNNTLIGARWNSNTKLSENHFSGWIEEVRIWKKDLTEDQVRFMMNQHLQNSANMGVEIPMPVPGGLTYADLAGYYRLISAEPDPLLPGGPITYDPALMPQNGLTPDIAINQIPGRLYNMTTNQQNTAPLPYLSKQDGAWTDINTWLRPQVWDIPNSTGIGGNPIEWNIVRTFHNITSDAKDITLLGLKSETLEKLITMANPASSMDETNSGQMMRVTHYLLLDGNMDLIGESQLLQDSGSILENTSKGWLERDQQGKRNSFVYNYWTSPVSAQGNTNNADYTVREILRDGTTTSTPKTINFQSPYWAADGGKSDPITISTYWIWGFSPAPANIYAEWDHVMADGLLKTGEGFTMKGPDGTAGIGDEQNYTFKGKPHNGDFELTIASGQNYLIGNPYPSAIDGHQFIRDNGSENGVFDGTIYFWDHFIKVDHILADYIGGYAYLNLSSPIGVSAISNDERIDANDATSNKKPGQFIPVSQGFMINTTGALGGDVKFRNGQRVYERETGTGSNSVFLSHERKEKSTKQQDEEVPRIRLNFRSPTGYHRQILAAAIPTTTNGFDWGYDARLRDNSAEDMFWMIGEDKYVIQAVPDFDKEQVLPLGVRIKGDSEFTFKIDTLENWPSEKPIYLQDHLNDSIHDLQKGEYHGTSEPGEILDRFEIIFHKEPDQIIPETPNPGAELTNIQVRYLHDRRELIIMNPDLIKINEVMIFDLVGKRIQGFEDIPQSKEIILNTRPIGSSVYIVKLLTPSGVKNIKFLMK